MNFIDKLPKGLFAPISVVIFSLVFSLVFLPTISLYIFQNPRIIEHGVFEAWSIWDAPHYLDIATHWYKTSGDDANWIVFLPLYPSLVAVFSYLPFLNVLYAGYAVSIFAAILSAVTLYKLVRIDEKEGVSFFSVMTLFLFPTSFFLFLPYPESIFLFLVLATFLNARRGHFITASLYAAFATATKIAGLALIPVIFTEMFLHHIQLNRKAHLFKSFLVLNLPIAGFLFYLGINYFTFGDILYFQKAQNQNWMTNFSPVVSGIKQAISFMGDAEYETALYLGYGQMIAFLLALGTVIYSFFKLRKSYFVYSIALLGVYGSMSFWLSFPRYLLSLFPLFIIFGRFCRNRWFLSLYVFLSLILLFVLGIIGLEHGSVL